MSKKHYVPSNGTEGMAFIEVHCMNCINGKYEHTGDTNDSPCEILTNAWISVPEPINEWIIEDGEPKCTCFKKWDWGMDEDGNWIDPPPEPIDDPNQLCLPFIFDELGIKQRKEEGGE